ncbi:MAG: ChaN family lipoprotein [Bacteroidales bacterium]
MQRFSLLCSTVLILLFQIARSQETGIKAPLQSAETYLISQFAAKDVIFLGEVHRIKEQVEFVGRLIPALHKNGINLLFSEFARYKDTRRIDSLITAPVFDKELAARIMYDDSWDWGYQEYIDLYHAAWIVNQSLPGNEPPFRIIGMEDYDNEFNGIYDTEQFWAHLIDSIGIKKGAKSLVWCGMHHAFTAYHQPYIVNDTLKGFVGSRAGNFLYRKYPEKVITVLMHGPWDWRGYTYSNITLPGNGAFDALLSPDADPQDGAGFSTSASPLGENSLNNTSYGIGYKSLTLREMCHGYLVIKPICELHPVTLIPGFINASNAEETVKRAEMGSLSPEAFNDTIESWLFRYSTKNLNAVKRKYCR